MLPWLRRRWKGVVVLVVALLGFLRWIDLDDGERISRMKHHGARLFEDEDSVGKLKESADGRLHVLVHARMRTGSTLTGSYFANHPDFFYVYEPGHMIVEYNGMNLYRDSFDYLEPIRGELVDFMHSFLHCNFTARDYFFKSINKNFFQRYFSNITHLSLPIREADVTSICRSKRHVVTKIIRLNNIIFASPVLRRDNVKVIHLVRDPRGMANSRRAFEAMPKDSTGNGNFRLPDKLEEVIRDDCTWMDTNYLAAQNVENWFKRNYMLVRYEDLSDRPGEIVPQMYRFLRLPLHPKIEKMIRSPGKLGNGQAWRSKLSFKEVNRIQEICPERVFKMFGYVMVRNEEQLRNDSLSLVLPQPDAPAT